MAKLQVKRIKRNVKQQQERKKRECMKIAMKKMPAANGSRKQIKTRERAITETK